MFEAAVNLKEQRPYSYLGHMSLNGIGTVPNPTKAIEYLILASRNGDSRVYFDLYRCYRDGIGVAVNKSSAFDYLLKAAVAGNIEANNEISILSETKNYPNWVKKQFVELSQLIENDNEAKSDSEELVNETVKAKSGNNDEDSVVDSADSSIADSDENTTEEVAEAKETQETKEGEAQDIQGSSLSQITGKQLYKLALMYEHAIGVNRDTSKALDYYLIAATKKYIPSYLKLGVYYENGYGTKRDKSEALSWYTRSAEAGEVLAQAKLGSIYYEGSLAKKDKVIAYSWWLIAGANGDDISTKNAKKLESKIDKALLVEGQNTAILFANKKIARKLDIDELEK